MSTTTSPAPQRSRFGRLIRELWFQVILGAAIGIAIGLLAPDVGAALTPLNNWFIALVKMIVVPVVFCVVTLGIASMDSLRKAGRIGVKALSYFILSMVIGLVVANVFKPGAGLNIDPATLSSDDIPGVDSHGPITFVGFVTDLIPESIFGAITGHAILSALLVSLLFGCALNVTKDQSAVITRLIEATSVVVFKIVSWVMRLAPIGTLGALASVTAEYGAESLQQLGFLILVFTLTCVIYVLVVLGAISRACGLGLFPVMRYFKAELLIALSTCSSEAVLPQLVRKLEELGVGKSVVGLVIPAGFSFNLDGSAVYLTMASLFLAQAVGIDLSWQQQLVMIGVMMLTSKGTAGIAGGAFIVLASTLTAVGHIPLATLALIVGIDRILNEGRVFINVLGNALATIVIGKWENDFDVDKARRILGQHTRKARKSAAADGTPAIAQKPVSTTDVAEPVIAPVRAQNVSVMRRGDRNPVLMAATSHAASK
ncbi:cation:dicarboxylase symporter family transporter [Aldersonia sp. NBC_00410]|uniref:cation:dicarboxylate symporter family transporter n=1 Tax=Aldersonia sp. NBC_00410 TaxID=2975954 RepID=UPI00224DA9D5|nr:cation:dicarboxylase symporter family transporter [Aldersonia sp. NBC_00410]MCX5046407.1 cation:dicarboxylase symporter family transporter [Aldersonia sp. NBC_00410]